MALIALSLGSEARPPPKFIKIAIGKKIFLDSVEWGGGGGGGGGARGGEGIDRNSLEGFRGEVGIIQSVSG